MGWKKDKMKLPLGTATKTTKQDILNSLKQRGMTPDEAESYFQQHYNAEGNKTGVLHTTMRSIPVVGDVYNEAGGMWEDITGQTAADAIKEGSELQGVAANRAIDLQREMYEKGLELSQPQRDIMNQQMSDMAAGLSSRGYDTPDFRFEQPVMPGEFGFDESLTPEEFSFTYEDFEETPYYQYLQDIAGKQVERSAAARGGLASGATLAGLQNRAQQIAGQEFGDQFNRALSTYGTNYNRAMDRHGRDLTAYGTNLARAQDERGFAYGAAMDAYNRGRQTPLDRWTMQSQLAGLGSPAFQSQLQAAPAYASNVGGIYGNLANAQAAGLMGQANARMGGTQNLINLLGLGIGLFK